MRYFNKYILDVKLTKAEAKKQTHDIWHMCFFNKINKSEQFTKREIKKLKPEAMEMCFFNKFSKGTQFTKEEIQKLNPDAVEMNYFNKYTKSKKFTDSEIKQNYSTYIVRQYWIVQNCEKTLNTECPIHGKCVCELTRNCLSLTDERIFENLKNERKQNEKK